LVSWILGFFLLFFFLLFSFFFFSGFSFFFFSFVFFFRFSSFFLIRKKKEPRLEHDRHGRSALFLYGARAYCPVTELQPMRLLDDVPCVV